MFSPGNGIGWILSELARSSDGCTVMSTSRVLPFSAGYSGERSKSSPISARMASSISRNSIGQRCTVSSEPVTMAAVSRLIASIGSSDGANATSVSMTLRPRTVSVVVPMPSTSTPSSCRKKQTSCTM